MLKLRSVFSSGIVCEMMKGYRLMDENSKIIFSRFYVEDLLFQINEMQPDLVENLVHDESLPNVVEDQVHDEPLSLFPFEENDNEDNNFSMEGHVSMQVPIPMGDNVQVDVPRTYQLNDVQNNVHFPNVL